MQATACGPRGLPLAPNGRIPVYPLAHGIVQYPFYNRVLQNYLVGVLTDASAGSLEGNLDADEFDPARNSDAVQGAIR